MMKKKSHFPLHLQASDKIGPVNKGPNSTFLVDQSYLNFQVAEMSAQRSMVETTPQLSSNSSSNLEISVVGEKETADKKRREEERFGRNLPFGIEQLLQHDRTATQIPNT